MTKILVTGASGFIGKHLIHQLIDLGHEVFAVDIESGDITEESTWAKFPETNLVIHLAGKSFVPDSWKDPAAFFRANLLGTVSSLNYCNEHKAHLIFMSSYMYGNPEILPIPETAPLIAVNPYALSKKLAEEVCRFYSDHFGISITILRLFNVYGPGQSENFIIPYLIDQVNSGKTITVKDLEPKRDFVYVNDVVRAIVLSVHHKERFSIFNIGSGVSYSVAEIIQIIQELKNTNLPVYSSQERRKDEIMNTVSDISEAKLKIGWEPEWSLSQGIAHCLNS